MGIKIEVEDLDNRLKAVVLDVEFVELGLHVIKRDDQDHVYDRQNASYIFKKVNIYTFINICLGVDVNGGERVDINDDSINEVHFDDSEEYVSKGLKYEFDIGDLPMEGIK